MLKLKILDIIILIVIIFCGLYCTFKAFTHKGERVLINANGTNYEYSLKDSGIYEFTGPIGITKVEIKDKKVKIIDSPCPNRTCMNQSYGDTIVCLPNRIIIKIEGGEDYDAFSE